MLRDTPPIPHLTGIGQNCKLVLSESLDLEYSHLYEKDLVVLVEEAKKQTGGSVVIDLRNTTYIDSEGYKLLGRLYDTHLRDRQAIIIPPSQEDCPTWSKAEVIPQIREDVLQCYEIMTAEQLESDR